jgi:hypothetical protein
VTRVLVPQLGEQEPPQRSPRSDPPPGSAGSAIDRWNAATDEAAEAHRRANRPGPWTEAEIETIVDDEGEVVSVVVLSTSGTVASTKRR